jgi:hypothetical protein
VGGTVLVTPTELDRTRPLTVSLPRAGPVSVPFLTTFTQVDIWHETRSSRCAPWPNSKSRSPPASG